MDRNIYVCPMGSWEVAMKISDFITLFEKALKEHGDI
jgi:hypothetical protein